MLARRFLGCVFFLTVLAVAAAFAFYQFGASWLVRQGTPRGHYVAPPPASGPDYGRLENWVARPGLSPADSGWLPTGVTSTAGNRAAATFYIHPTTYLETDRWNAPLTPAGQDEARIHLFVRSQASAFNGASDVWAPRYRQAAYGAFLLNSDDARKALDLAYRDVLAAFDAFIAAQPAGRPLLLAGHSQGSLHLLRLLADRRDALKGRLVAAYVAGWPVSTAADLPATGLAACAAADQPGCLLSWQSFAVPAHTKLVTDAWVGTKGLDGAARQRRDMLCVNPLTGTQSGSAPPSANTGSLIPDSTFATGYVSPGLVGARCDNGFLLINGAVPAMGPFVLPGNNYHVYDYALFWGAIRADSERRLAAWQARQ
jgi:hypothetical protein